MDNYFVVLETVGEEIEDLEEELLTDPKVETSHRVHHLKRELIFLRRCVWPLREVISTIERGDSPLIQEKTRIFFKDVYDHTVEVIETVETFRDMVSGMIEVYLSSASHRLNEVMKVLTMIATLFIPLTFLAGVYGMNFKYMPELEWKMGYALIWLVMILVGGSMLLYFRKKEMALRVQREIPRSALRRIQKKSERPALLISMADGPGFAAHRPVRRLRAGRRSGGSL